MKRNNFRDVRVSFNYATDFDQHKHVRKLPEAKERNLRLEITMPDAYTGPGIVPLPTNKMENIMAHSPVSTVLRRALSQSQKLSLH